MFSLLYLALRRVFELVVLLARSRERKEIEILVLRHELGVLRRQAVRSRYEARDRTLLAALSRLLPRERWTAFRVTPETLLRWHASVLWHPSRPSDRLELLKRTRGGNLMSGSSSSKPRRRRSAAVVSLQLLLLGVAVLLVVGAPAQARRRDLIPPKFAGLKSATTCIPGPIGEGRTSSYHLSWEAATDNVTPSSRIVYNVYQATTAGGEDFSKPTYTTAAGVTSFDTPQLPTGRTFYFVVRARDRAGNEDSNTIEREGQNLCL